MKNAANENYSLSDPVEFERRVTRRVAVLTDGWPRDRDVAPVKELVRKAHEMGFDLLPMDNNDPIY